MLNPLRQTIYLAVLAALASLSVATAATASYQYRHSAQGLSVSAVSTGSGSGTGTTTPTNPVPSLSPAVLSLSTTSLSFGSVSTGQTSAAQSVMVGNHGQQAMTLQAPGISGPYSATHNCPASLPGNTSCAVSVTFSPQSTTPGPGVLTLVSSVGTQIVSLSGSTTAPAAVMQLVSPSSNALTFGSVANGTTVTQSISIKNNGPQYATALSVTTTGTAAPYAVQSNTCTNIAQGADCSIVVAFTANGSGGTQILRLTPSAGTPVDISLSGATAASTDANWSNVGLLMSFEGGLADATGKTTATASGGAAVTTAQAKFGTGALALNGTSSYVTTNAVSLGAGAFTVESWVKTTGTSSNAFIIGFRDPAHSAGIHLTTGGFNGTGVGTFRIGGSTGGDIAGTTRIDDGTWHHIALTRDSGNALRLFVDGKLEATGSDTTNYTGYANRPIIGVHDYLVNQDYFNGYVDEVRITPGVARYTANFSVPTTAFPKQ
jgi:hypothetical protein